MIYKHDVKQLIKVIVARIYKFPFVTVSHCMVQIRNYLHHSWTGHDNTRAISKLLNILIGNKHNQQLITVAGYISSGMKHVQNEWI